MTGGSDEPDRNSKGLLMHRVFAPGIAAGLFFVCLGTPSATAQSGITVPPEITVFSPFRGIATPIARAGSSVSVITREEIERAGYASVADILRTVPGITLTEAGGLGSQADVLIRGAEQQHTLVLLDGVPVSDTTSVRNTFDFRSISPELIEQIEVLRGPQSALYGSDAIGGVINIVTRQANRGMQASVSVEGGSYGTHTETLDASYGGDRFSVFGALSHTQSDGFSRRSEDDEDDGVQQWSGFLRGTTYFSEVLSLDVQLQGNDTETEFDQSAANNLSTRTLQTLNGSAQLRHAIFDNRWVNTLKVYGGVNDTFDDRGTSSDRTYDGRRLGVEWVSESDIGDYGTLLTGASMERQSAEQTDAVAGLQYRGSETYLAAFAMHQFSLTPNFHLSAALRFDDFDESGSFLTGRATAVYDITETETRLRASVGTGARAPSLFQRFSSSGNTDLVPDESISFDVGINQILFDGRLTVDIAGFYNQIDNMIDYDGTIFQYRNITEAETYGVEVQGQTRLIPGQLDASAHYTYLVANDVTTGLRLQRRPEHEGQLSLTYYGIDKLSLTATATAVGGDWFNDDANTTQLDPYVRVDLNASYQAHDHLEVFGRVENLFDADYEERAGFNTPGLSVFAGIRATLQ